MATACFWYDLLVHLHDRILPTGLRFYSMSVCPPDCLLLSARKRHKRVGCCGWHLFLQCMWTWPQQQSAPYPATYHCSTHLHCIAHTLHSSNQTLQGAFLKGLWGVFWFFSTTRTFLQNLKFLSADLQGFCAWFWINHKNKLCIKMGYNNNTICEIDIFMIFDSHRDTYR